MQFSGTISQYQELLMIINNKTAEQRVAVFLLDYSNRLKSRGLSGVNLHLCMSRGDIGSYLGLAAETVSRSLSKFEHLGIITVHKKNVRIASIQKLKDSLKLVVAIGALSGDVQHQVKLGRCWPNQR